MICVKWGGNKPQTSKLYVFPYRWLSLKEQYCVSQSQMPLCPFTMVSFMIVMLVAWNHLFETTKAIEDPGLKLIGLLATMIVLVASLRFPETISRWYKRKGYYE